MIQNVSQHLPPSGREHGAVVDMAWAIPGGSIRLSIHATEPLGEYDCTQLAEVVRRVETLVHTLAHHRPVAPPPEPAGAVE